MQNKENFQDYMFFEEETINIRQQIGKYICFTGSGLF